MCTIQKAVYTLVQTSLFQNMFSWVTNMIYTCWCNFLWIIHRFRFTSVLYSYQIILHTSTHILYNSRFHRIYTLFIYYCCKIYITHLPIHQIIHTLCLPCFNYKIPKTPPEKWIVSFHGKTFVTSLFVYMWKWNYLNEMMWN